jgi:hypothetical protein
MKAWSSLLLGLSFQVPKNGAVAFYTPDAFEIYLIAAPSVMLGAILLLGGIILLLEAPKHDDQ